MHCVERSPRSPALRPWVGRLWALTDAPGHARESILPSGTLELVFNLHEDEFRIYAANAEVPCQTLPGAILSGAYDRAFTIDTREHASVVGVHFEPGGASAVLGLPVGSLRNTHVALEALWGTAARRLRERLCEARSSSVRFELLEAELCRRSSAASALPPCVPLAIDRLEGPASIAELARQTGLSHRRFIECFTGAVGLTPKVFARVRRFQHLLDQLRDGARPDWSRLAVASGYFDQSHLIRDFTSLSGLTPSGFAALRDTPVKAGHVALAERAR